MIETARQILVTGASGFAGRHIVEQLCRRGYGVRALIRRVPERGFGPSVKLIVGDLNQPETYASALDGVTAIVHAALTDDLSHEPRATSTLQSCGAQAGVRQFIHLSSIAVYGNPPSGTITEETAPIPASDAYSHTKLAIEEALRANSTGLEVVILRLGCVYGPGGGWWTGGLLNQMQRGKLILVDKGTGIANLIHASDVGSIAALVLQRSNPPFEIFNVTDGTPVAWSRYFAELEKLAGRTATVSMSVAEAREHGRKWLRPSLVRRVARKISGAPLIYPLDDRGIENFTSRAVYSNQKMATVLNFTPEYNLESGMRTMHSSKPSQQMLVAQ
jgi:nucleoside-diphosphate-sugar epimerase